ncbi:FliM/FliN family flagellar motor C-terminal domain-containing protein [Terriglobus tenax]|uniref:FliM/FliN family flagellar motor C-terminal domain-containing protein n=1 Tax=Terriglobus tenax TaxID=1111115 RepID=UPI0021DF618E|nr:FliM/FliN family flagellar motor C-terminal domain-containing protein [Terriglobus tenax]
MRLALTSGMENVIETGHTATPEPEVAAEQNPAPEEWSYLAQLPVPLAVSIPLPSISLGELMQLAPGQVLVSNFPTNQDVPLVAGELFLAMVDFERAGDQLGVRISGFQMGVQP